MKFPVVILVAGLALASSLAAKPDHSAQARLESYYLNPQPAEVPRLVKDLSRQGYFDQRSNVTIAIGFLSTIFAQNSDRVDAWLLEFNHLPQAHHRLIACALWQAGNPLGVELLQVLGQQTPGGHGVIQLASQPVSSIADTPVTSISSMNLQWGAFLASGDEHYITNILEAIGTGQPGLDEAARYAFAQNAATHPRVMEICQAELAKQPAEAQSAIRAALNDGSSLPDRPRS